MNIDIPAYLAAHSKAIQTLEGMQEEISRVADSLVKALKNNGKILVMGNGGSAADAQHLAAELVGRFEKERTGLPAIAITTDSSILTAVSNDFGYERVFARQVEALAGKGDIVIGISTSGQSPNVIRAVEAAKEKGCLTVGLLGRDGGQLGKMVDLDLTVPVAETPHIQEAHAVIIHLLCMFVDTAFSKS